jgi:hypothetical protein
VTPPLASSTVFDISYLRNEEGGPISNLMARRLINLSVSFTRGLVPFGLGAACGTLGWWIMQRPPREMQRSAEVAHEPVAHANSDFTVSYGGSPSTSFRRARCMRSTQDRLVLSPSSPSLSMYALLLPRWLHAVTTTLASTTVLRGMISSFVLCWIAFSGSTVYQYTVPQRLYSTVLCSLALAHC